MTKKIASSIKKEDKTVQKSESKRKSDLNELMRFKYLFGYLFFFLLNLIFSSFDVRIPIGSYLITYVWTMIAAILYNLYLVDYANKVLVKDMNSQDIKGINKLLYILCVYPLFPVLETMILSLPLALFIK